MSFDPNPTVAEGGRIKADVTDGNNEELLGEILKELKIMNIHLSMVTDNWIDKEEI